MRLRVFKNIQTTLAQPNKWDMIALLLVFSLLVLLAWGAKQMAAPYHLGEKLAVSLDTHALPYYAVRTVLRMLIALVAALVFTFTIGTLAAKNKHAERVLIPMIDIAQSIPILGFLSITIVGFIALFPNSLLGPECAAIFGIFTGQVWNMCLGFYQSVRTVPYNLREASAIFQLSAWQRFWRVDVPFAMPSLIWNMMMSMSGSWFFIVASEAITVNKQEILLPGIGSYIGMAIAHQNKTAVIHAIITMFIVIVLYDQLLFRPLVQWSEKFKFENVETAYRPKALLTSLLRKTRFLHYLGQYFSIVGEFFINFPLFQKRSKKIESAHYASQKKKYALWSIYLWYGFIFIAGLLALYNLLHFIFSNISISELPHVLILGGLTAIKISILIVLCSLVWVPIGVWVGLRPNVAQFVQPIAQFLAAFPTNLFFPIVVILILKYALNTEIWTTPLMILGTQWYILFNVIAGASALPKDLVQVADNLGVKKWLWWKRLVLPGIFPYFITGAITAAGGAWNASIISEVVSWGNVTIKATGLGAYIADVTSVGDFPHVALGIGVMCLYVIIFNRLIWHPLYNLAEKRYQLD